MSRKEAREYAFLYIYQYEFVDENSIDNIGYFLEEYNVEDNQLEYFNSVIKLVNNNIKDIDDKILENLKGWSISRINKIDLAILRLAIAEILYMEDIPYKVSINEAVEISKKYGDDNSPNFINGLLAKINKK